MKNQEIQKILFDLIRFKTETKKQSEVKRAIGYIGKFFAGTSYAVKRFAKHGVHSLLVYPKGTSWRNPEVLLNGHVDVVPASEAGQYAPFRRGHKVFGRGSSDMKGGLSAIIGALLELDAKRVRHGAAFLVNGDEEVGGAHGAGYVVNDIGIRPKFVVVADNPRHEGFVVTTKEKGGIWLELTARGRAAHAAYPWLGENALEKLIHAVGKIQRLVGKVRPDAWKTTVNLSGIHTDGATHNMVPAGARAMLDLRFTEEFAKSADEAYRKVRRAVPGVEVRALVKVAPLRNNHRHAHIRNFRSLFSRTLGRKIPFGYGHGASDARYFGARGIPSILVGTVGAHWHSRGEWVDFRTVLALKDVVKAYIVKHHVHREVNS
ncbi:MAG: M20/M25/M40 family metallo-hydrolase [Candidatus Liptonbacteria bacterium]|nr:M20/M25/M40 family metallo-hydrolase [Candidatus Liptonbacteria bacterium]